MKNINLKIIKPAKRYADAFFEVVKNKNFSENLAEIEVLNNLILTNEKFRNFLFHPIISSAEKKSLLNDVLNGFGADTLNFIFILTDENRLNSLSEIYEFLKQKADKKNNILTVEITTARTLTNDEKKYVKERLNKKFEKEISAKFLQNEAIIGGMLLKSGDTVIDLSIKKKLENFKIM